MDGLGTRYPAPINVKDVEEKTGEVISTLHYGDENYSADQILDVFERCIFAPAIDFSITAKFDDATAKKIRSLHEAAQKNNIKKHVEEIFASFFPDRKPTAKVENKPAAAAVAPVKVLEEKKEAIEPIARPKEEDTETALRRAQEEADAELARLLSLEDQGSHQKDEFAGMSAVEHAKMVLEQERELENIKRRNELKAQAEQWKKEYETRQAEFIQRNPVYQEQSHSVYGRGSYYSPYEIPRENVYSNTGLSFNRPVVPELTPEKAYEIFFEKEFTCNTDFDHEQNLYYVDRFASYKMKAGLKEKRIYGCDDRFLWIEPNCDGTTVLAPRNSYFRVDSDNISLKNAFYNIIFVSKDSKQITLTGEENTIILLGEETNVNIIPIQFYKNRIIKSDEFKRLIQKYEDVFVPIPRSRKLSEDSFFFETYFEKESTKLTTKYDATIDTDDRLHNCEMYTGKSVLISKNAHYAYLQKVEKATITVEADHVKLVHANNCTIHVAEGVKDISVFGSGNIINVGQDVHGIRIVDWLSKKDDSVKASVINNPHGATVDYASVK